MEIYITSLILAKRYLSHNLAIERRKMRVFRFQFFVSTVGSSLHFPSVSKSRCNGETVTDRKRYFKGNFPKPFLNGVAESWSVYFQSFAFSGCYKDEFECCDCSCR